MRVHKMHVQQGKLQPGVFRDIEGGMSVNWQKYCANATKARALAKKPADNGVISLVAGEVRGIPSLTVKHTPDRERNDRSHAEVFGEKTLEVRVALVKLSKWEIPVDAPVE
jgi:hypothetical protein